VEGTKVVPTLRPKVDIVRVTSGLAQVGQATEVWALTSVSKSAPQRGQWYS